MAAKEALRREIVLNGRVTPTQAATLAALLDEQGYAAIGVATAVNGNFVPERARAGSRLQPGDRVEIVSARQGG